MKFGDYDVKISPLGWLTLAAAAVKGALEEVRSGANSDRVRIGNSAWGGTAEMAWRLNVYIVNPDDEKIYVKHEFYGETKADAEHVKKEHLASCEYFRAAEQEGRTVEEVEEIDADDWPDVNEDDDDSK